MVAKKRDKKKKAGWMPAPLFAPKSKVLSVDAQFKSGRPGLDPLVTVAKIRFVALLVGSADADDMGSDEEPLH